MTDRICLLMVQKTVTLMQTPIKTSLQSTGNMEHDVTVKVFIL